MGSIEWTDRTWNPLRGCSRISEGCRNCYAERIAARFESGPFKGFVRSTKAGPRWTGKVELVPGKLREPLRWKEPCRVFVNSMSDLFHEDVPDEAIDQVFAIMADAPWLTFQVLTKRPARALEYLAPNEPSLECRIDNVRLEGRKSVEGFRGVTLPLRNVWIGTSVEDAASAASRVPLLLQTPAAVRFLSVEPLLERVDLRPFVVGTTRHHLACDVRGLIRSRSFSSLLDEDGHEIPRERAEAHLEQLLAQGVKLIKTTGCDDFDPQTGCRGHRNPRLDWVIVGGESGPGARPFDLRWARDVVAACTEAKVPVFVKQLGSHVTSANDQGFDGESPSEWPMGTAFQEVSKADRYQGAPVRVFLRSSKGGDPAEWPEEIRVRQFPATARATP